MVEGFYFCCEFFSTAVKVWATLKLAGTIWEPRQTRRVEYGIWMGTVFVVAGLNTYNNSIISVLYSSLVMMIWISLLTWISRFLYYCQCRDVFCLIFFIWTMLALFDMFFQTLAYVILGFLNVQRNLFLTVTIQRAVYQMLWIVLFICGMKTADQWRKNREEVLYFLKWVRFFILPLLFCVFYFQRIYKQLVPEKMIYYWWIFLLASLLMGVSFLAYIVMQRERENSQIIRNKLEMTENEYRIIQQVYEEINILRHDFEKHKQAMHELMELGRGQEVFEYLEDIGMRLRKTDNKNLVNHELLNLILNRKFREGEMAGISIQYDVCDMSGLQLKSMEIVALFSNILDNAIEANLVLENGIERWMSLACSRKGHMLVISASNSWVGGKLKFKGGIPRTTKEGKGKHGAGMRSIRQVAERYGGHMMIETGEKVFGLTVYLKGFV